MYQGPSVSVHGKATHAARCGRGACVALLGVLALCVTQRARAQGATEQNALAESQLAESQRAPSAPEVAQCENERIRLEGAASGGGATVSFRDEWTSELERVVRCVRQDTGRMCVRVQGRYDDVAFSKDVVAVYGSQEAAQRARAEARAAMVMAKLLEFGLQAEVIQQLPAPAQPSFRGVQLVLVPGCQKGPVGVHSVAAPAEVDVDALAAAVAAKLESASATAAVSAPNPNRIWFDAGLDALYSRSNAEDGTSSLAGLGRVGVGWHNQLLYTRAYGGLGGGGPEEQRVVYELGGAFGYYHATWLQLGLAGLFRRGSPGMGDPWLVQTWGLGLEGNHCAEDILGGQLCLREMLAPVGAERRRGEVSNGDIVRTPETSAYAFTLEVGVTLRYNLWEPA